VQRADALQRRRVEQVHDGRLDPWLAELADGLEVHAHRHPLLTHLLGEDLEEATRGRPQVQDRVAPAQEAVPVQDLLDLEGRPGPQPLLLGLPEVEVLGIVRLGHVAFP